MAAFSITFSSFIISFFLLSSFTLHSAHKPHRQRPGCPPFSSCGIHDIKFPFSSASNPECGLQTIECQDGVATIKFDGPKRLYIVSYIDYTKNILGILDDRCGYGQQKLDICHCLDNFTTPISHLLPFQLVTPQYTFLKCSHSKHQMLFTDPIEGLFNYSDCHDYELYYYCNNPAYAGHNRHNCSVIYFPLLNWTSLRFLGNFTLPELLAYGVSLQWNLTPECVDCRWNKGGSCGRNRSSGKFTCSEPIKKKGDKVQQIKIGLSAGFGGILLACLVFIVFRQCHNRRLHPASSILLPRAFSSFPYSKPELGKGSTLFYTQIFNYKELEEATDNFNPLRKLGGGGFGTVYYGKLRDGRFVAVKRLYENSYKQMEQFRNEIGILSRSRHQNLVTLYGCGSRHSHELLLVYEFIPNGTVADHLHCNRAKPGVLTWPIRLSIAIETADALAYLHNVEIIHRDVKTNNILLDNDFHVKVADFGLSRLFSFEVSHVSTTPQGTPGYVDPNYHRYYQLTDKSDVYSFGVVLIELISSMPAVDVTRHQHEISLANMAINKIQNDALHELVDPALGFDSNFAVRRMITLVAELAFRCLQDQREVRPSMEEVLQVLRGIGNEIEKVEKTEEVSTMTDHTTLLKQVPAMSPDTVTDAWVSRTGTPDINVLHIHSLE